MTSPRPTTDDFTLAGFTTSSYSVNAGQCVAVAAVAGWVAVRDSKSPDTGILIIPASRWATFTSEAHLWNSTPDAT